MCISPKYIPNNSTYYDSNSYQSFRAVPCGQCVECRDAVRNEWRTRLSYELKHTKDIGGTAIFLTFSFNDYWLPRYKDGSFTCTCFNHDYVLTFLNRLKVAANKRFGKGSYKYFFVSEYGKDTKRPHHHCEFFLRSGVDWREFTELCREKWQYGFMFPKYSKRLNMYVGNDGKDATPVVRDLAGNSNYVSKYVTKDMAFYDDKLSNYISDPAKRQRFKPYLPKHWQSKHLGYSILDGLTESDALNALDNGITDPNTLKVVPLPQYAINKLLYRNIPSLRSSAVSGKMLYDRSLTKFGRKYFGNIFDIRVRHFCNKCVETVQLCQNCYPELYTKTLSKLVNHLTDKPLSYNNWRLVAYYHFVYDRLGNKSFDAIIKKSGGDLYSIFNYDDVRKMFIRLHDLDWLRLNGDCKSDCTSTTRDVMIPSFVKPLHDILLLTSSKIRKQKIEQLHKKLDEIGRYRRLYNCKYDKNLV